MLWSSVAFADVLNVEFKFTPFTGDLKNDKVDTVPGKARVFLNNALMAEQDIEARSVPVIFDEREIASAVWVPMALVGLGDRLHQRKRGRIRRGAVAAQLDLTTTGNAEVLVRRKGGALFVFERIKGDDVQMRAGMSLLLVYPPQMAFVRTPGGD